MSDVNNTLLSIRNLQAKIDDKKILNAINLNIKPGEIHAIMGPNGSGKSTLANVLAGREAYEVTDGTVQYQNHDLLALSADERAREGIFLAFQYPVEIPGVSNVNFLKVAANARRKQQGQDEYDAIDFLSLIRKKMQEVDMDEALLYRSVNEGFSGGEKKRNEILQMLVLQPELAILDETDSGLDIDALKVVAKGVNAMRDSTRSFLLITHYQRLLDYIVPDYVHVLYQGRIVKSGDAELAHRLEKEGYNWLEHADVAPDQVAVKVKDD